MSFISGYDKELFRHALLSTDERSLVALILKIRNPRIAVLLIHQYLVNHLKDGCQGCSMCCKKEGAVDLDSEDLKRIAFYLKMRPEKFLDQYVQKILGDNCLKDLPGSDSCIFLRKGKCSIYPVRPNTCVLYPFIGKHQSNYLKKETNSVGSGVPTGCASAQRPNLIVATLINIYENNDCLREASEQ
jgi:uncharacterized protein